MNSFEVLTLIQDAVYGKGNTGALKKVLKRKADDKETQNIDVKVTILSTHLMSNAICLANLAAG